MRGRGLVHERFRVRVRVRVLVGEGVFLFGRRGSVVVVAVVGSSKRRKRRGGRRRGYGRVGMSGRSGKLSEMVQARSRRGGRRFVEFHVYVCCLCGMKGKKARAMNEEIVGHKFVSE